MSSATQTDVCVCVCVCVSVCVCDSRPVSQSLCLFLFVSVSPSPSFPFHTHKHTHTQTHTWTELTRALRSAWVRRVHQRSERPHSTSHAGAGTDAEADEAKTAANQNSTRGLHVSRRSQAFSSVLKRQSRTPCWLHALQQHNNARASRMVTVSSRGRCSFENYNTIMVAQ